jgi:hypothetical protein
MMSAGSRPSLPSNTLARPKIFTRAAGRELVNELGRIGAFDRERFPVFEVQETVAQGEVQKAILPALEDFRTQGSTPKDMKSPLIGQRPPRGAFAAIELDRDRPPTKICAFCLRSIKQ